MKAFGNLGSRSFDSRDLCGFQRGIEGFACVSIYNFFFFYRWRDIQAWLPYTYAIRQAMRKVSFKRGKTDYTWIHGESFASFLFHRPTRLILDVFFHFFSHFSFISISTTNTLLEIVQRRKKKKNFFHRFTFQRLSIFQSLVNNGGGTRIVIPNGERLKLGVFIQVWSLDARPGCNHFISTFTRELPGGGGPRQFARHFTILPIIKKKLYGKSRATRALASATGWFIVPPPIFCFALLAVLRLPSVIDSDLSVEKDDTRETIQERTVLEGRLNGVAKANSNDGAGRKVKC